MIVATFRRNNSATSALFLQCDRRGLACRREAAGCMHTFPAFANVTCVSAVREHAPLAQTADTRKGGKKVLNWIVWPGQFLKVITNMEEIRASG